MQDITVIFRRRGGDDLEQSHTHWARTVSSSPDIIEMTFVPITDLIEDLVKRQHLARAVNLYLERKLFLYLSKSSVCRNDMDFSCN